MKIGNKYLGRLFKESGLKTMHTIFFPSQVQFKGLNGPSCQMIDFVWCHSIQFFGLLLCSSDLILFHFEI